MVHSIHTNLGSSLSQFGIDSKFIVKFRINRTLYSGSVRKPNLPGDESVSLFLGFTIDLQASQKARKILYVETKTKIH